MSYSDLYLSGVSRTEIARRFNLTYEDVSIALADEFFYVNDKRIDYQAERSINWKEAQAALGLPYDPHFRKNNPQLKSRPTPSRHEKDHTRHNSFRYMEREASAFWAGWVYGDVQEKFGIDFYVDVEKKDREKLYMLQRFLGTPTRRIVVKERTKPPLRAVDYRLVVRSLPMSRDLFMLGRGVVIERPHNIPEESVRHFLRGYIERYGTLRNGPDYTLVIPGSPDFIKWVQEVSPTRNAHQFSADTERIMTYNPDVIMRWHDFLYFNAKVTTDD